MDVIHFQIDEAFVTGYIHEDHDRLIAHKVRPALIICPGGGYNHVSRREADPPALAFSAIGYQVFHMTYSLNENAGNYRPLHELAEVVKTVRERAGEWHINPEKIAVMGFSAGGHLAASLAEYWNHPELGISPLSRPNALLLSYPVITLYEHTHQGTSDLVSGGDETVREALSLERHVTKDVPPTFLWHTVEDEAVPVENSLLFMRELQKNGVSFEAHIFAHGPHGQSVCTREVEAVNHECRKWVGLAQTWLNNLFGFEV